MLILAKKRILQHSNSPPPMVPRANVVAAVHDGVAAAALLPALRGGTRGIVKYHGELNEVLQARGGASCCSPSTARLQRSRRALPWYFDTNPRVSSRAASTSRGRPQSPPSSAGHGSRREARRRRARAGVNVDGRSGPPRRGDDGRREPAVVSRADVVAPVDGGAAAADCCMNCALATGNWDL